MLSKIYSSAFLGIDAYPVEIEVDVTPGLPAVKMVGMPNAVVKESKDRVCAAIKNSRFQYPARKIVVNLAPADLKKEGPSFDLPVALGILASTGQLNGAHLKQFCILGELALDGQIRPVRGVLPVALSLRDTPCTNLILPEENAAEAAVVRRVNAYPVRTLAQTVSFLNDEISISPVSLDLQSAFEQHSQYDLDYAEVKGQELAKRALEVAVAGGHNIIMIGPPGSGKTMLARRLPTIIPDITLDEAVETTRIHSVAGLVSPKQGLVATRPFRSPHHTSSDIALVGGGSFPKPGEVSLAHHGVLFLDELPEFPAHVLEVLRQPLEDGCVTISRASKTVSYPARFILCCAMNPCPCGYYTDPKRRCRCNTTQIQKYLSRVSGPLLDRIDIHVDVPAVKYKDLSGTAPGEPSAAIRKRVNQARARQAARFGGDGVHCNAEMRAKDLKAYCALNDEGKELLKMAIQELGISARAYDRILKVARTITDLAGSDAIEVDHLSEAIQYRSLDRNLWV